MSIGLCFIFLLRLQDSFCFSLCLSFAAPFSPLFFHSSYLAQLLEKVERLGIGSLFFMERKVTANRVRNRLE